MIGSMGVMFDQVFKIDNEVMYVTDPKRQGHNWIECVHTQKDYNHTLLEQATTPLLQIQQLGHLAHALKTSYKYIMNSLIHHTFPFFGTWNRHWQSLFQGGDNWKGCSIMIAEGSHPSINQATTVLCDLFVMWMAYPRDKLKRHTWSSYSGILNVSAATVFSYNTQPHNHKDIPIQLAKHPTAPTAETSVWSWNSLSKSGL